MTGITVVSCTNRHASLGNWYAESMSIKLITYQTASCNDGEKMARLLQ